MEDTKNSEHQTQGERLDAALRMAAGYFGCKPEEIEWSSWIHMFGNTGGPKKGGIVGQAFTAFRVFGFIDTTSGEAKQYCAGVWMPWHGIATGWHVE